MFQFITKYTVFFELFVLIVTCLVLLVSIFFLPESPKYLINKCQTEDARKALNTIARFNKIIDSDFSKTVFKVETVTKSDIKSAKK